LFVFFYVFFLHGRNKLYKAAARTTTKNNENKRKNGQLFTTRACTTERKLKSFVGLKK